MRVGSLRVRRLGFDRRAVARQTVFFTPAGLEVLPDKSCRPKFGRMNWSRSAIEASPTKKRCRYILVRPITVPYNPRFGPKYPRFGQAPQ